MHKKIYGAYGANTNLTSMAIRCPDAEFIGLGFLKGWQLEFRGVADIVETHKDDMTIALWAITKKCERSLDRFEGFPSLYVKKTLKTFVDPEYSGGQLSEVLDDPTHLDVMYYVMNPDSFRSNRIAPAPTSYYECLYAGYEETGIPLNQLFAADGRASQYPKRKFSKRWN